MKQDAIDNMIHHALCHSAGKPGCREAFVGLATSYLEDVAVLLGIDGKPNICTTSDTCLLDDVCLEFEGGHIHLGGCSVVYLQSATGCRSCCGISLLKNQSLFAENARLFMRGK